MENESVFDAPEPDPLTRIAEALEGLIEILKPRYHIPDSIPIEYAPKTKTFKYTNAEDCDNDINAWMEIVGATEILNFTDVQNPESTMGRMKTIVVKAPKPVKMYAPPEQEINTEEFDRI